MRTEIQRKMFMGIWGLMLPVPVVVSAIGMKKSVAGARKTAALLSTDERRVHHFVVKEMAVAKEPISMEFIAEKLDLPLSDVNDIVDKLEKLKTFVYRKNGPGINWAFPHSLENTGHRMMANSGERFFAA